MVISTIFRRVTRRSILVVVASTASCGLAGGEAVAQTAASPISGPAPEFNLSDIPLAEGERIISSSISGAIEFDGQSYQTVDPLSVPGLAGGDEHPPGFGAMGQSEGFYGNSCANGGCGQPGCRNARCGGIGGRHGGGPRSAVDFGGRPRLGAGGTVCGPTCNPYRYATVDALYMGNNELDNFGSPALFNLGDFDYELGIRATIGYVPDCRNGFEFTFTGPFQWTSQTSLLGADYFGGNLDSLLTTNANPPIPLDSFVDAESQFQRLESEYLSFEANKTLNGWEVVKLLYGVRYIQYEEDYIFGSTPNVGLPGLLRSTADSRLIGGQVGIDLTYPLTCRMWSDMRLRGGAFANFHENSFQLVNQQTTRIFNSDNDVRLAGMFEISGGLRYYVTNNFHIRGGGELWYLSRVGTALDQFNTSLSPRTGQVARAKDDILMYGASVGAEWKF